MCLFIITYLYGIASAELHLPHSSLLCVEPRRHYLHSIYHLSLCIELHSKVTIYILLHLTTKPYFPTQCSHACTVHFLVLNAATLKAISVLDHFSAAICFPWVEPITRQLNHHIRVVKDFMSLTLIKFWRIIFISSHTLLCYPHQFKNTWRAWRRTDMGPHRAEGDLIWKT
jgi:hypothetical protein